MKIRVEYDPAPIRHIAVQCPQCGRWFRGYDITEDKLSYEYQIYSAQFHCPVCDKIFGACEYNGYANVQIKETDYPDVYKDCLERKEVWEQNGWKEIR